MINGLPAHPFLVHFIVVLALLTAVLAVLCAVWPAARQRLVWLVLALAVVTAGATPLTTESGEWLEHHLPDKSELVEQHAALGETMLYFSLGLLVAAVLLVVAHRRRLSSAVSAVIAVFVIAASGATMYQVYRIGDSGAKSVWGDAVTTTSAGVGDDDE